MARQTPKKTPQKSAKSAPRRRSSASPQPAPPTPRRSVPLNFLLRALSTPPRPPSHHPFLRAFSMPLRRRVDYSPLVRRLCQQDAHTRLPYDNEDFVKKVLPCESCRKTGTMTQNIVFKQGHAGEWVRVCCNVGCGLIYYPAQPGTPPRLLEQIEAARDADAFSSTTTTPESKPSHSPAFFSSTPPDDLDIAPPLGGKLEDWLSPLIREIDEELKVHTPTVSSSNSGSEPVAGPSTVSELRNVRNVPARCARDEQIARMLQAAADAEASLDVLYLQQFEEESPATTPPPIDDHNEQPTTLSSLTAELAAITQSRSPRTEESLPAAVSPAHETPSRCSSPESSPSPRPRKKKRILVKPTPTPPPVPRKIYGPVPKEPTTRSRATKAKVSAGSSKPAKSNQPRAEVEQPHAKSTKGGAVRATSPHGVPSAPVVILISSDEDLPPKTRPAEGSHRSDVVPSGGPPRIARSCRGPRAPRRPHTRPAHDDESDIINITSSDSDSDGAPRATQPRAASTTLASRKAVAHASPAHDDHEKKDVARVSGRAGTRSPRSPPPAVQPRINRPRADPCSRAPPTPSSVVDNFSSESDSGSPPPPSTQPRTVRSRAVVRSRAPSLEVATHTHPARDESEDDSAPPGTQLPHNRPRDFPPRKPTLPALASHLQDASETGSSNKENNGANAVQGQLDSERSARLSARQATARRRVGIFAALAQTSSSSSSTSSPSSSGLNQNVSDDEIHLNSDATVRPASGNPSAGAGENAGEHVDAAEVFGDPFRFEVYPVVPGLVTGINPYAERQHWILTIKIWYKNNLPPCTKMIALDYARCSIRLSDIFITARAFQSTGITYFRVWNRSITDWDTREQADYLSISVTDNHTLLIRFPAVRTLPCWAENISQAYGLCQTVDPRPPPSRKGKELAYY